MMQSSIVQMNQSGSHIIYFSPVRWAWHKILITEICLCVKHTINTEIWFSQVKRETTICKFLYKSYLLSGVTSGCHFQPVFVTKCRDLWSKILDYAGILVKVYLSPEQFWRSSVTVRMEGLLAHTEAWGEPGAFLGKDKGDRHPTVLSGVQNITAPSGPSILSQTQYMTPSHVQNDDYCAGPLLSCRDGRHLN